MHSLLLLLLPLFWASPVKIQVIRPIADTSVLEAPLSLNFKYPPPLPLATPQPSFIILRFL